ncbi:MAG TPA: kynureninase, partial [Cyclobacteriaceae bacterium]|nr:kynureninase [Cyclobacteriaceae bacterium]
MMFENTKSFAQHLDQQDPLRKFRSYFHIPEKNNQEVIYFCGNSLGLQPKSTRQYVEEELADWENLGVEGHVAGKRPWKYYHKFSKKALAQLTGAKESEVVSMNNLTSNLHLLMVSFYRPNGKRNKIIAEAGAFPSDQYALESQLKFHGFNPDETLIELKPRAGEFSLRTADILNTIQQHQDEIALVLIGGVQYYSGQLFDIKAITAAAHKAGAFAGFDLAHAIGNVPLNLHEDEVDFAVWCSYKYLNAGPGANAGAFVHERHATEDIPRFAGWWGHHEAERFQMRKGFKPMPGVDGWQLANVNVLSGAALLASLAIFEEAGIENLRKKSLQLTGYLEFLLNDIKSKADYFKIITPSNPNERGCQLSILMKQKGKEVYNYISEAGIVDDWREPDVIRVAPVPLYN